MNAPTLPILGAIKTAIVSKLPSWRDLMPDRAEKVVDAEVDAVKAVRANRRTWPLVLLLLVMLLVLLPGSYLAGHWMAVRGADGLRTRIAAITDERDRAITDAAKATEAAVAAAADAAKARAEAREALAKLTPAAPAAATAVRPKKPGPKR